MTLHIIDCEQGSDEWRSARCGIPTASRFSEILAKGEGRTRAKYLRELAAERMRGYPEPDSYSNSHMDRGHEQEAEARALYSMTFANSPVRRVGFIHNGRAGCSPDSLVGDDGGLEIKSALGHIQVEPLGIALGDRQVLGLVVAQLVGAQHHAGMAQFDAALRLHLGVRLAAELVRAQIHRRLAPRRIGGGRGLQPRAGREHRAVVLCAGRLRQQQAGGQHRQRGAGA